MNEEHKEYLDDLRESGETNMWLAPQYVIMEFGVTKQEARQIVKEWMESFNEQV